MTGDAVRGGQGWRTTTRMPMSQRVMRRSGASGPTPSLLSRSPSTGRTRRGIRLAPRHRWRHRSAWSIRQFGHWRWRGYRGPVCWHVPMLVLEMGAHHLDDAGIPLPPSPLPEDRDGFRDRHGVTIRTVGRQCIEGIGDSDDARADGNIGPRDAVGIAGTIPRDWVDRHGGLLRCEHAFRPGVPLSHLPAGVSRNAATVTMGKRWPRGEQ